MTKYDASQRVKMLLSYKPKEELAKQIGISRPTLNTRLERNNWKVSEIFLIEKL